MTGFKLIFVAFCALSISEIGAKLSDKRLCANADCTEPISRASTLLRYTAGEEGMLSFEPNKEIVIFSKSAGSNPALWGAEYEGKRGYVPSNYVRENKVLSSKLPYTVDTEVPSNGGAVNVEPHKPLIIDGTTVYDIDATSTEETVAPTSTPSNLLQGNVPKVDDQLIKDHDSQNSLDEDEDDEDDDESFVDEEDDDIDEEIVAKEAIVKETENNVIDSINNLFSGLQNGVFASGDVNEGVKPVVQQEPIITSGAETVDAGASVGTSETSNTIVEKKDNSQVLKDVGIKSSEETKEDNVLGAATNKLQTNTVPQNSEATEGSVLQNIELTNKSVAQNMDNPDPKNADNSVNQSVENPLVTQSVENPISKNGAVTENPVPQNVQATENSVVQNVEVTKNPASQNVVTENSVIQNVEVPENNFTQQVEAVGGSLTQNEGLAGKEAEVIRKPIPRSITVTDHNNDQQQEVTENLISQQTEATENPYSQKYEVTENPLFQEAEVTENPLSQEAEATENPLSHKPELTENQQNTENSIQKAETTENTNTQNIQATENLALPTIADTENRIGNVDVTNVDLKEENKTTSPQDKYEYLPPFFHVGENKQDDQSAEKVGEIPLDSNPQPDSTIGTLTDDNVDVTSNEIEHEDNTSLNADKTNLNGDKTSLNEDKTSLNEDKTSLNEGNTSVNEDNTSLNKAKTSLNEDNTRLNEAPLQNEVQDEKVSTEESQGFFGNLLASFWGGSTDETTGSSEADQNKESNNDVLLSRTHEYNSCAMDANQEYCTNQEKPIVRDFFGEPMATESNAGMDFFDVLKLLGVSGTTIVVFLWGYLIIDKMRKEAPLIAKINNLEKTLLVSTKENQILSDKLNENQSHDKDNQEQNVIIDDLQGELETAQNRCVNLEEQIQLLEKELENSTEVGLELNRMLTDIISSQNGSDTLMENIEQLQNRLVDQQGTINTINAKLNEKDTENHELQLELEINNKKVTDLQSELDKMVLNLLKIEEEKEQHQQKYEAQIVELKDNTNKLQKTFSTERKSLTNELIDAKKRMSEAERNYELKVNEYNLLRDNVSQGKSGADVKSLLDVNAVKAEMQQLQREKATLTEMLQHNQQLLTEFEAQTANMARETETLTRNYEEADSGRLQALTKLEVLHTFFKEREAELQRELAKHESLWLEKRGETNSTTEKIKFMQDEVQNFKTLNESLKQEIVSQEVELKSQISVLEKKAHENWVRARQAERKFEDSRQEAAQLRNRLTLQERTLGMDKTQNRLQSPLESNGDHPLSPMHMGVLDSSISPSLMFGTRDHLTTSPPIPGLPPFMPPPPGVPFMPPPMPGMPPFMPPPLSMFPGDHRPPPLGRMSSPPLNSRYSPESRPYSPYDRNSPSPTDDEYYGPPRRGYSPYNGRDNRRDYGRNAPPPRANVRNAKGAASSGSANSNESLEKMNRHNSKV